MKKVHEERIEWRNGTEAERIAEQLRARGFKAYRDYSGECRTDELGHWHPNFVRIILTPQLAKLLEVEP